jgi:glutathione S-transferase
VDAYFVPVLSRFRTYAIDLAPTTTAYAARIEALPAHVAWRAEAAAEPFSIQKYEYALDLA